MWTTDDTINTGINILIVKESKLNPQSIFKDSQSIHLNSVILTGILFIPTSIKHIIDNTDVLNTDKQVINWDPLTPIFLPKNPDIIEANKGKNIIVKYIIYIL
jgi:hypothetical protein